MNGAVALSNARRAIRVIARAIACSLLLALPACGIPKFRQAELGTTVPPSFNGATSPESSAKLRVDEFYSDPALTRLVCEAVTNNRELKILNEEVEIARAAIISRRGAFFPLVGFRAGLGWDRNSVFTPLGAAERELEYLPGRRFPATPGDSLLAFDYLVPLDIWRELRNARDAATQRYYAAMEKRSAFVTRLVADVAANYYTLLALDTRLTTLDQIISIQKDALTLATANFKAGRDTDLPVQRFQAEVSKNQSEKLIVGQEIVETENRVNTLVGRFPQPVERTPTKFFDLTINSLNVGVPAQLLMNRPDIRQAERELAAAGLDVKVARAHFFPRVDLTGSVGYRAFNPKYLFNPEALILTAVGELVAPVLNKAAIRAEYLAANASQLEAVYNYQQVIINAVTEVINWLAMVDNYSKSIEIKKRQLQALEASVEVATRLFRAGRIEYNEVLFAQRDLLEAQTVLIATKKGQLSAVVNAYQSLGGGSVVLCPPEAQTGPPEAPQPPPAAPKDAKEPAPPKQPGPPALPAAEEKKAP